MDFLETKIKILREGVSLPKYQTENSAAMDISYYPEDGSALTLVQGQISLLETGIALAIPHGYEVEIRPRSGLALKYGFTVVNSPGTIDSDYRGEIKVIAYLLPNKGNPDLSLTINPGDRIAQMKLSKVERINFNLVEDLDETTRGAGGFGHTGV